MDENNIKYWNKIFKADIKSDTINDFDDYVRIINSNKDYEYDDEVCLFFRDNTGNIDIINCNGKAYENKPGTTKEIYRVLNKYKTIVTNCYLNYPQIEGYEKRIFRKELLENYSTCYPTHCIDTDKVVYAWKDNKVFLNYDYHRLYKYSLFIQFCSELLSKLEYGKVFDDLVIRPEINISQYGRWYYSKFKIQNNKNERQKTIDILKKYDKIILTADIVSAEPSIIYQTTKSETIKMLINKRINTDDEQLRTMIKYLLNVYLHSALTPQNSFNWFKQSNPDYNKLERYLNKKIIDIYYSIDDETKEYNNKIINCYKEDLMVSELNRTIVNPYAITMSDSEILKEHRKVLQGHTQDIVLWILFDLYLDNKIKIDDILWTIYDSFSLFIKDETIMNDIKEIANRKGYNIEMKIEN